METLVSGLGKNPFTIQPGDRLRSANHGTIARTKVKSVEGPTAIGQIIITTDEDRHVFEPGQPVVFPRRPKGLTKVHLEPQPHLGEVFVGDVIAPPGGWPTGLADRENGRFITDIQPSRRFGGFIISYRRTNGGPGGKMLVSSTSAWFYSDGYQELSAESGRDKPVYKPEPKNASGVYEHLETGEQARFRIAGKRGRSPEGNVLESPGAHISVWDPWLLVSGNRHPSDPRK